MFTGKSIECLLGAIFMWDSIVSGSPLDFEASGDTANVSYAGKKQSPINISMKSVIRKHYDNDHLFEVLNRNERWTTRVSDEHQAMLNASSHDRKQPTVISGSLLSNQTYVFFEAHVHRSHDDDNGTEHSFDGKRFAAELHCVHVNSKYANVTQASSHPDGLAVIGILFKVDDNAPYMNETGQFETLCESFDKKGSFNSSSVQPKLTSSFFHYNGSLTLPPYRENVHWIVLTKAQPISSATMRLLRSNDTKVIESHSVRAVQPIKGRTINLYER